MTTRGLQQSMAGTDKISDDMFRHLEEVPVHDVVSALWRGGLHDDGAVRRHVELVAMATLAYLYKKDHLSGVKALQEAVERYAIDETTNNAMKEAVNTFGEEIISFSQEWPLKKLLATALFSDFAYARCSRGYDGSNPTPASVCYLAMELLHITGADSLADVCSGTSGFLIRAALHTKTQMLLGIENDADSVVISRLRSMLLGNRFHVVESSIAAEGIAAIQASKVFLHPPLFSPRAASSDEWNRLMESKGFEAITRLHKPYRVGWLMLLITLRMQSAGGRTVALVPDALLRCMTGDERAVHRQLTERGLLEAVIALPQGLQPNVRTSSNLLVCSENNESVRMVDATDCFKLERSTNVMTQEDIDVVLQRVYENTKYSRNVSLKELTAREYDLRPSIYLEDSGIEENNSISLETVLSYLGRGKVVSASELNKFATQRETEYQYLMIRDIVNDTVQMPLAYLSAIEPEWERFCVQEGDIVISRSVPYKIALIPDLHGKKVLASANLYFLRPDEAKINPIYLLGYLKSEDGMRQLKHSAQGGSMLLQKELKQLRIPKVPMRMQFEFARQYLKINAKIQDLRRQEKAAEKELESIMAQMNRPIRDKGGIHYGGRGQER